MEPVCSFPYLKDISWMGLRSHNKKSPSVNMYLLWEWHYPSSVWRGEGKTDPERFFFLSVTLLFAFCCNNSPDRKIEVAASDKGQKINIQCNWLYSERIKKTHVAQLITAGATFAFCARLQFVLPASDRVSGLLHSFHCLLTELSLRMRIWS